MAEDRPRPAGSNERTSERRPQGGAPGDGQERLRGGQRVVAPLAAEAPLRLHQLTELIWLGLGILEGLIGLRVLLKLIAANPDNPFASFIYRITALFLGPFFGLTASPSSGPYVLEVPSLIAMLVYALAAWALVSLIWTLFERRNSRRLITYEREREWEREPD